LHATDSRRKRRPEKDFGTDRAVITAVLLSVTIVLLMIGFAGPSVYFVLPGPRGWLYIGAVLIVAATALARLSSYAEKRKKRNTSGLRTFGGKSKRLPLR
jgi:hypothetical protein